MVKKKSVAPDANSFMHAYLATQRPTTSHLYYSKGILDFLVGMLIGIVIGVILVNYI